MRPPLPGFSQLRVKITQGGSLQRLLRGTAIPLTDYQRRWQIHRETMCLQFL